MAKDASYLLEMDRAELERRMKEVYQRQKLSPRLTVIARSLDILFSVIFVFVADEWLYKILWTCGALYAGYKLMKPHSDDKEINEKLEKVAEGVENLRKFKNGEINLNVSEKDVEKAEKGVKKFLPHLLKNSTPIKVMALIPIISLYADELSTYTDIRRGGLTALLSGKMGTCGLNHFTNDCIIEEDVNNKFAEA